MATYTVVKGDCLWSIASRYLGSGLKWTILADLNGISRSRPIIYPGQVLKLDSGSSGGGGGGSTPAPAPTSNAVSLAKIEYFGLQAGTDRTVFAAWSWDKANTENYQVIWYYDTGNGLWFIGNDSTTNDKQSVYTAPSNAKEVKCKVKPISTKHKVNGNDVSYWTVGWSSEKKYNFSDNPPTTPPVPTVTIKDYTLKAEVSNVGELNATEIQFEIVKDNSSVFNVGKAKIITAHASYSCTVNAGCEYKVRARAFRGSACSDWSEYSSNAGTKPAASSGITICRASSETSVYLAWAAVTNATSYEIEYTTKKEYFDGSDQTNSVTGIINNHYEKTGLESGKTYFFRVRAVNDNGSSAWSGIKSVVIGKDPSPPTTWSSTTTAITGEPLTLYWIHNSEDESSQTYAEIELYIDGVKETHTINSTNEDDDLKTTSYDVDTSEYPEGTKIQWRVRTAGVTKIYSDWSIQRTIDIYAPPTIEFSVTDSEGNNLETLTGFPFYVSGVTGPNTQTPIGYHITITSNDIYQTIDNVGNVTTINKGGTVYSKYFDTSEQLLVEFSANNIDLENNINYTITCVVSMNSGLTAEASSEFTVSWIEQAYDPDAEIGINEDTLTASIRPYCLDENGDLVEGVTLSVYRREFDGGFTEVATGISNTSNTFVTDPHPSLDYARYRIVAVSDETGAISFTDLPGYPVSNKSVIIQWDEQWSSFNSFNEDVFEQPPWSGSLLKLPYNIDVSHSNKLDVSLVEYIGRKHPVSYYGTQIGETDTWRVDIEKSDKDTLYALRRLAVWMGDVYVREPSGVGYWANISVSISQTHGELTTPVSLSITRVEGGV